VTALVIIGFLAIAAAVVYLGWWAKKKRREELARMAAQLGLQYSQQDTFNLLGLPFELFRMGDGRGTANVLSGTWQDIPLQEFDYWYYEESTDSQGHRSKTYYRFNCVLCPVDAACPELSIDHENLFSRIADHLSFHDIEFESEEFNRKYNVKCSEKKFANDFVDARMIEWLMRHGDGYSFEACADQLLVAHRRLQPVEMTPLLGTAQGFSKAVPRVVFELYPKG
jgi:hypothetical protein